MVFTTVPLAAWPSGRPPTPSGDEEDPSTGFADERGDVFGRETRLMHAQQLVQARDQELILILRAHPAAVAQAEYVDVVRGRAWFGVSDGCYRRMG